MLRVAQAAKWPQQVRFVLGDIATLVAQVPPETWPWFHLTEFAQAGTPMLFGPDWALYQGGALFRNGQGFEMGEVRTDTIGVRMLMVSAAWQVFDATATSLAECLRAAGDTLYPLVVRLLIAWLVFVPGAWFTVRSFGGGEVGAMVWLVIYIGLLALVLLLRFRSGKWRTMELIEP